MYWICDGWLRFERHSSNYGELFSGWLIATRSCIFPCVSPLDTVSSQCFPCDYRVFIWSFSPENVDITGFISYVHIRHRSRRAYNWRWVKGSVCLDYIVHSKKKYILLWDHISIRFDNTNDQVLYAFTSDFSLTSLKCHTFTPLVFIWVFILEWPLNTSIITL